LNDFVVELATIAGSKNKLTIGGVVYTKKHYEAKTKGEFLPTPILMSFARRNSSRICPHSGDDTITVEATAGFFFL